MTQYHLTPFQLLTIFEKNPIPFKATDLWERFEKIVPLITKPSDVKAEVYDTRLESFKPIGGFKQSKGVHPLVLNDVVLVRVTCYYPTLISQWEDAFTVENFHGLMEALHEARLLARSLRMTDVADSIKKFSNMVFGQLPAGVIRHKTKKQNDLLCLAKTLTGQIFEHETCHHANIDEFVVEPSGINNFITHAMGVLYEQGFSASQIDVGKPTSVIIGSHYDRHKTMKLSAKNS